MRRVDSTSLLCLWWWGRETNGCMERWVSLLSKYVNVIKKASSYIAQYPVLGTTQSAFTLYFPDRPVHSDTISASLGSIQPYAAINACRLLVHISTTVYSQVLILIQLSELEQCRMKKLAQGFNTASRIRTRVLVVESPKLYP